MFALSMAVLYVMFGECFRRLIVRANRGSFGDVEPKGSKILTRFFWPIVLMYSLCGAFIVAFERLVSPYLDDEPVKCRMCDDEGIICLEGDKDHGHGACPACAMGRTMEKKIDAVKDMM
jgi:hypothetical protein